MTAGARIAARFMVHECMRLKPGERFLAIAHDRPGLRWMADLLMEAAADLGAEPTLMVMSYPRLAPGYTSQPEPPPAVAGAMSSADAILHLTPGSELFRTKAARAARTAGARFYAIIGMSEEEFVREFTLSDLQQVAERTEKVARLLEKATRARITSPLGTDLDMRLSQRPAIRPNPLSPAGSVLPIYAEAAVAPEEGTGEGVVAASRLLGWGRWARIFERPLMIKIVGGRAVEFSGDPEAVDGVTRLISTDETAANFPAEFAIGTSHLVQRGLGGTIEDAGRVGVLHLALGGNDWFHGATHSGVHIDTVVVRATVELDGTKILVDGHLEVA